MSTNASVICWDELADGLFRSGGRQQGIVQRTLHVDWAGDVLKFTVLPEGLDGGSSKVQGGAKSISRLLQEYASALYSLSAGLSRGLYLDGEERESARMSLESRGEALFRRLIPRDLQWEIQGWADRTILQISTNEQWVPWELMYDGKGFLGQRMLLVRMPCLPVSIARDGVRRWPSGRPTLSESGSGQKILNVIGGGLKKQAKDCKGLFRAFVDRAEIVLLHERPLWALAEAIRDADLVHFTCHGRHDPLRLQIYKTDDHALNLLVDSVAGDAFCVKPRCVVYANACSSAASEMVFDDFVGFAWNFYTKGAAAYIGTVGAVPTKDAMSFASRFYSRLANGDMNSIYSAYQATREEAFSEGPSCLLFCIYGNYRDEPSFRIP